MTTPLPSAHEPLPADFLRKYGAQKDMKWRNRHCPEHPFVLFLEPKMLLDALDTTDFEFCAPIGTIAAATTPLPERVCDCGAMEARGDIFYNCVPSCSIHRTYVHILPHALAALPEKPEGLICNIRGQRKDQWVPCELEWPFGSDSKQLHWRDWAYAIPAQPGQGKGETIELVNKAIDKAYDRISIQPRWHNPDNLPSAGEPPWRFLVEGEGLEDGDMGWLCMDVDDHSWQIVDPDGPVLPTVSYRTLRPLSTQPEGGEPCAPQQMPATSVAVGHTAEEQVSARSTPSPSSASNAAPANVPTVAGSGQREGERDRIPCPECNGTGSIGKVWYYIDRKTGEITYPPSPPSTAGETPRVDELAPQWARNGITGLRQAIAFARDLERELWIIGAIVANLTPEQLAEPMAVVYAVEKYAAEKLQTERQLAAAEAWKDEISAAIQRSGLGIMRTSQGPVGTIICTRPEVKDAEDRKVLELINENIDLETRIAAVTAERDEAMKRLETIQTT